MNAAAERESFIRRAQVLVDCENNREAQDLQKLLSARDVLHFFRYWGVTYDPRLILQGKNPYLPFDLFPRQEELIRWLEERLNRAEEGIIEKSRGVGFTWLAAGFAVNKFLFVDGFLTSFGSRKLELVDKIGDSKSIFEKIRIFMYRLPQWMLPPGFDRNKHDNLCKIVNPQTGALISGEAGDQIGRGGRSALYAQPLDAKVLTPGGWMRMGDLKVGSVISTPDGKTAPVSMIVDHGLKPTFKVTLSDGASTECTDDHLWEVIMPRDGWKRVVKSTREIREKLAYSGPGYLHYRHRLPRSEPLNVGCHSPPLDPYLMGVMLGDGTLPLRNKKFVPDEYKFASPDARLAILQGLMDADGCTMGKMTSFITTSPMLVEDVIFLVRSLGGVARTYLKPGRRIVNWYTGKTSQARDGWHVNLSLPEGFVPFRLPRKADKFRYKESKRQIIKIEPVGNKVVRCIEVLGSSHLYVTDDFIVTHNCIDEASFLDNAESIAASVSDNADCRIWASTVNGPGNVFARKRHDGGLRPDQIFTFHYSSDPRRTPEWAVKVKASLAATPWIWASEFEIDYHASVEGICIPGAWVNAAVELGKLLPKETLDRFLTYPGVAGLDVGDGTARSVFQPRFGPLILPSRSWTRPDTTTTALEAVRLSEERNIRTLHFDEVGVGKGVLSTLNGLPQLTKEQKEQGRFRPTILGVNVGRPASWQTQWPDGQSSRQKFANLKAEVWWIMRERFRSSWEHLRFLRGEDGGIEHDLDDVLIFPPSHPLAEEGYRDPFRELIVQLGTPKCYPNTQGKMIMESKAQLATRGVASPDEAEALSLTFVPATHQQLHQPQAPIVATRNSGFPELSGGQVPSDYVGRGHDPAVATGGKFDRDFARDW